MLNFAFKIFIAKYLIGFLIKNNYVIATYISIDLSIVVNI